MAWFSSVSGQALAWAGTEQGFGRFPDGRACYVLANWESLKLGFARQVCLAPERVERFLGLG